MSKEYQDINKDEPGRDPGASKQSQAQTVVAQAQAQAKKIIQNANMQAKQIIAAAREKTGEEDDGDNNTIGQKWVYNKDGESKIISGDTPDGWYDEPQ